MWVVWSRWPQGGWSAADVTHVLGVVAVAVNSEAAGEGVEVGDVVGGQQDGGGTGFSLTRSTRRVPGIMAIQGCSARIQARAI